MLTLATWNVLAPAYALPTRYEGVPSDLLEAPHRTPRVHARLEALLDRCDVVAVQEADLDLVGWLREVAGASVLHAPRPSSVDGVLLASRRHRLDGLTGGSADQRRTWAAAEVSGVLVVSVHLDPEWPAKRLRGAVQAAQLVTWLDEEADARAVVIAGDINASWDRQTGDALRWGRFDAQRVGATAATNGKCRELDVIATRGCVAAVEPTGLPPVGTAYRLPDLDVPSDHAPLLATIR